MLGFDALGRLALGQSQQSNFSTASLVASLGTFNVAGQQSFYAYTDVSAATTISYLVAGSQAQMVVGLASAQGSYSAAVLAGFFSARMANGAGPYVVVGNSATLGAGGLPAAPGALNVTSSPIRFVVGLSPQPGQYSITMSSVSYSLDREAWYPLPGQSEIWTGQSVPTDIWTPAVIQSEGWTNSPVP